MTPQNLPAFFPILPSSSPRGIADAHCMLTRSHRPELADALESYSSHLEPSFVQVPLPPSDAQAVAPTFDLSPAYVDRLDAEFARVYDEYSRRIGLVQALADDVIQLWVELGTPQAQQDSSIVKYYRDAPEQLGLHQEDMDRLRSRRDRLADEKKSREKRLRELRTTVEALWAKLEVDEAETKAFLKANRGCGLRQINEFEDELARLQELKRQNLHLFVEDARVRLQDLWDALYLSEDEMLDFTPAFSDVYSDALLEAHEREISRLEAVREQRAPILALVDRHKALLRDRDELEASSQDASRLMMRGQRGEKRDPGKLLREEKMRKRITKELPKVTTEVRRALEKWEEDYDRPFLVFGLRYLDELDAEEARKPAATTKRSKTPASATVRPPSSSTKPARSGRATAPPPMTMTTRSHSSRTLPPRAITRTPTAARAGTKRAPPPSGVGPAAAAATTTTTTTTTGQGRTTRSRKPDEGAEKRKQQMAMIKGGYVDDDDEGDNGEHGEYAPEADKGDKQHQYRSHYSHEGDEKSSLDESQDSPLKGRTRLPLSTLRHGGNMSPERARPASQPEAFHRCGAPLKAPPPKTRHLGQETELEKGPAPRPVASSWSIVRQVEPEREDPGDGAHGDGEGPQETGRWGQSAYSTSRTQAGASSRLVPDAPRQISNTSTVISENWETYNDDDSEPEPDASETYYAKLRAARGKRLGPDEGAGSGSRPKRMRGLPATACARPGVVDEEGKRLASTSDWTDDDMF